MTPELSRLGALAMKELRVTNPQKAKRLLAAIEASEAISDLPDWARAIVLEKRRGNRAD